MNNNINHTKEYLSVKEISGLLNLSEKTVYKLFHSGSFPVYRFGGKKIYVKRKDFISWCEKNRI